MYSAETDKQGPPPDAGKYIRLGIIAAIALATFAIIGNQAIVLSMNVTEFEDKFTKPLYYSILSGLILSSIALIRVNIAARSSIFWFLVSTAIGFLNRSPKEAVANNVPSFKDYKLSVPQFAIWQISKVLLFGAFFVNIMFGFAASEFLDGNDLGVENLPTIFSLPFVTPPTDPSYATENVVPMIPALVILISPLLAAIGLRLVLYVGLHSILGVATSYIQDSADGKPRYLNYVSTIEAIIGIGVLWAGFNLFFTDQIDYNTRYAIGGTLAIGFALIAFSFLDRFRARVLTHMLKRDVYIRILTVIAIAIVVGGIMSVNDSIADARKIEYLGPYTAQQIGVNRYLGQLDMIQENKHDVNLPSVSANDINNIIQQNQDVLDVIRIWDWEAAFAKLKPEIGLIPYVDFEDNDILRFNNTLYWTASMKPILPPSVSLENRWYNEHFVYTHVPNGFLTLEATGGQITDSSQFFEQRKIYYGEGGLLEQTWSGYPTGRGDNSAEIGGAFYAGKGGIEVGPPISWIFEPNFLLSFPTESVHILRYKDIHDRMELLYPYFLYDLFGRELDTLPVTDGENSYWLVPLIAGFDTNDVPWSVGNPYLRLVGYALINTYDGDITLLKTGDDFFADMFVSQYSEHFEEMPQWLDKQARYPVELFNWKTEMYNIYHVTDVEIFIQSNEFYEIPRGLNTYYIEAKPPGFDETKYLGLLSLELRGSQGRNLAGYMIVENDVSSLGNMQFYEVPLNSTTKLIGPSAVREALDRDPEFAQLNTLLRNPRIGDNILYKVGEHDTYFIPVYTAGAGGVVSQIGTIAAVGAAFTGEYYVGLGDTQQEAFKAYLQDLSGIETSVADGQTTEELTKSDRIEILKTAFKDQDLEVVEPTAIQVPLTFKKGEIFFYTALDQEDVEEFVDEFINDMVKPRSERVFMWKEGENIVNFGTILVKGGISELHYVSIEVGK
ncbi:MAG: hypothetical protein GWN01_04875 [Nitrosopumilaceae archaeon]|nr:hypothetical protein [Nitrosopumilaceae archaeon]NIU00276.1 hypothetical protein [Nitrosopumilaceae archaeon]NIU86688.1 hypothetical protein [Nitrosopumilaceae archaeon]NIV65383.1 hypothetical protein [Nitrosopumilaceae archaeon]NIX60878.1 hypothetical protein [Nitrosopumilaceae archaeon]